MNDNPAPKVRATPWVPAGVALGVAIGAALNDVGMGIAIGLMLGSAVELLFERSRNQGGNPTMLVVAVFALAVTVAVTLLGKR